MNKFTRKEHMYKKDIQNESVEKRILLQDQYIINNSRFNLKQYTAILFKKKKKNPTRHKMCQDSYQKVY